MVKAIENIELKVDGMDCSNCALGIQKHLEKKKLENVYVNHITGEVRFSNPLKEEVAEIIKGINSLGYHAYYESEEGEHHHSHFGVEKKFYLTLPFTVPLFFHMFLSHEHVLNNPLVQLVLCLPVLVIGFIHFGKSAFSSIKARYPNMDVLIFIGSTSAFIYSLIGTIYFWGTHEIHDYLFYETCATIITLVLLGNVMEHRSVNQTTSALRELNALQAKVAKKIVYENNQEKIIEIEYEKITEGDNLLVNTGDKIPADGKIIWGNASIDESMITGEGIPVNKSINSEVIGGTILLNGTIKVKAERVGKSSVLSQIVEMVKSAQQNKPSIQKLGDKASAVFVPVVLLISLGTFITWYFILDNNFRIALMNSIAVLVISCPCAMGLATPTAVMVGIGKAAREGILIKGADTLEKLAKIKTFLFDKTGTITTGNFLIQSINPVAPVTEAELKRIISGLEKHSSHPIAKSINKELENIDGKIEFKDVKEIEGRGMEGWHEDSKYSIGSALMLESPPNDNHELYVLKNGILIGTVDIKDEIKTNSLLSFNNFKANNINTVLLSGDKTLKVKQLSEQMQISTYHAEKLPSEKLKIVDGLSKQTLTAMVGDGINDAPALSKASVGISMGNATEIAKNSAQVIIMDNHDLYKINKAWQISKMTYKTIKQNLFWAFFYNVIAIPVAAAGFLNPMIGALAMAFSDVIVIGNSIRLKYMKIKD